MSNETTPRNTREDEATLELKLNTKIPHHEAGNPIAERVDNLDNIDPKKPDIGTAFLANGFQFVLYKPSEAFQKPERKAIIRNYFYENTITMFYGEAGSYKSFWAIWECISFALGKELCGMQIESEPQKTLYISLEMSAKDIADRIKKMTNDLSESEKNLVEENFIIISAEDEGKMKALNNPGFLDALKILYDELHFNICYIDSFADYIAGLDVRQETPMGDVITDLRTFTLSNHVSFRIIHHATKISANNPSSMAGIHTIRDLVDQVYFVNPKEKQELTITNDKSNPSASSAKQRYGDPVSLDLKFVADEYSFSFKRLQEIETASHIEKVKRILTTIEENQGISAGDLRDKCGNFKGYSEILKDLIHNNSVIMDDSSQEPGQRGSAKKRHYTTDYYRDYIQKD